MKIQLLLIITFWLAGATSGLDLKVSPEARRAYELAYAAFEPRISPAEVLEHLKLLLAEDQTLHGKKKTEELIEASVADKSNCDRSYLEKLLRTKNYFRFLMVNMYAYMQDCYNRQFSVCKEEFSSSLVEQSANEMSQKLKQSVESMVSSLGESWQLLGTDREDQQVKDDLHAFLRSKSRTNDTDYDYLFAIHVKPLCRQFIRIFAEPLFIAEHTEEQEKEKLMSKLNPESQRWLNIALTCSRVL